MDQEVTNVTALMSAVATPAVLIVSAALLLLIRDGIGMLGRWAMRGRLRRSRR